MSSFHTLKISQTKKFLRPNSLKLDETIVIDQNQTGVIGVNGSGKTTFLKTLLFCSSNSYDIYLDDIRILDLSYFKRSKLISYLPHSDRCTFDYLVKDFILFGRYPFNQGRVTKQDHLILDKYLEALAIKDLKTRSVLQLSKGEYQKVCLCQTLCAQTPCLILDEPFSNLDIRSSVNLLNLLKDLSLNQLIIASFQNLRLAQSFSPSSFVFLSNNHAQFKSKLDTEFLTTSFQVSSEDIELF